MTKDVDAGIFIALATRETQLRTLELGQDVAGDQLTQCGKWWYERDPVSFQNQGGWDYIGSHGLPAQT